VLAKLPVNVPSIVFELVIVGFSDVLQQIPLTVIGAFPLEVIFPPETADVRSANVTAVVVIVGAEIDVVVNVT
jgi:hypothetical protein